MLTCKNVANCAYVYGVEMSLYKSSQSTPCRVSILTLICMHSDTKSCILSGRYFVYILLYCFKTSLQKEIQICCISTLLVHLLAFLHYTCQGKVQTWYLQDQSLKKKQKKTFLIQPVFLNKTNENLSTISSRPSSYDWQTVFPAVLIGFPSHRNWDSYVLTGSHHQEKERLQRDILVLTILKC